LGNLSDVVQPEQAIDPTPPGRRIRGLDAAQRRDQRRDQLLEAALELFAARGYVHSSVEQICQTASVSTKSFYELFDSREACYLELLRRVSEQIMNAMVAALDQSPDDERSASLRLLAAFAHAAVSDPRCAKVVYGSHRAMSHDVERVRRENRRWAASFLEAIWRRYGIEGDNHRVAVAVIGGLFDLVTDWLLDSDPADPTAVTTLITDLQRFYTVVRNGLSA
jgi:AcrR family transcriptional regulator